MNEAASRSIGDLLRSVPASLRLDAELLVGAQLGLSRASIIAHPERDLGDADAHALEQALRRRRDDEPLAYLLGTREFYGLDFNVTPAVLVPRPDTELLVERILETAPVAGTVLELGTGSGVIAVAVKHQRSDLVVTATDLSAQALDVARGNAARHQCEIEFLLSNWYDEVSGEYAVIASNPPYIAADDPHLNALRHEPQLALTAADDGLAALHEIIRGAPGLLAPRGTLLLEHGAEQATAVATALDARGFEEPTHHVDLGGHLRVTAAVWPEEQG